MLKVHWLRKKNIKIIIKIQLQKNQQNHFYGIESNQIWAVSKKKQKKLIIFSHSNQLYSFQTQNQRHLIFFFNALPTAFNPLAHFADTFFRIHMILLIFFLAKSIQKTHSIWILKNQHHVLTSLFRGYINLDKLSTFQENSFLILKVKKKNKIPILESCC